MNSSMNESIRDEKTIAYFDSHTPSWSIGRYRQALAFLGEQGRPHHRLIDVGCGSGNILRYVRQHTPVQQVTGMDVSPQYLEMVASNLQCETVLGSVLDEAVIAPRSGQFDFALMGDVLHHLVGRTRKTSQGYGRQAIGNALRLLKPGGYLLILEPCFLPSQIAIPIFYLKVLVTTFSGNRLEFSDQRWLNIGAPVVSFYSQDQLTQLITSLAEARLISATVARLKKIGLGVRHGRMTFIVQKGNLEELVGTQRKSEEITGTQEVGVPIV
jgi:SAM-dependent methyltransferase